MNVESYYTEPFLVSSFSVRSLKLNRLVSLRLKIKYSNILIADAIKPKRAHFSCNSYLCLRYTYFIYTIVLFSTDLNKIVING